MTTVACPPEVAGGIVIVFGPVRLGFTTVRVVKLPAAGGDEDPEETGTATITVPVPPSVAGGLVKVLGRVKPPSVTVTVVYGMGRGGSVDVADETTDPGTTTTTVARPPAVDGG